jgi:hypothetical protein
MGANAFWNSFGSESAMTLTLAILPGRLARTHHRAGADQVFPDNTIDHRSKLGIVIERGQLLQGAVGFL